MSESAVSTERALLEASAVEEAALVLKCLGHPVRLHILDFLDARGESSVTEVYEGVGIEQAVASQHLSLMHTKGVIERRKDGVHVYYRLADDRARRVLACVQGCGPA